MNKQMLAQAKLAKAASEELALLTTKVKNKILTEISKAIKSNISRVVRANQKDMKLGRKNQLTESLLDRLSYPKERIESSLSDLENVIKLPDPIGEIIKSQKLSNGLKIKKIRVPLGVIGIIYEARPNVTLDVISLCLKTGNAVLLKGSEVAYHSNKAIIEIVQKVLVKNKISCKAVQFVDPYKPELVKTMLKTDHYINLVIPRGGKGLIDFVRKNATVPIIETGAGICHVYVDKGANIDWATKIIYNAKVQRPSVCNAIETVLVHKKIALKALPEIFEKLNQAKVELRCDDKSYKILSKYKNQKLKKATKSDFATEFLDLILSIKVVDDIDKAINHIKEFGSGHSEAIISDNKRSIKKFFLEIDAAAVYANTSTRFTDGSQFGLGAEIGISTQKLHARGPMGLCELTSYKWIIKSDGQIRK